MVFLFETTKYQAIYYSELIKGLLKTQTETWFCSVLANVDERGVLVRLLCWMGKNKGILVIEDVKKVLIFNKRGKPGFRISIARLVGHRVHKIIKNKKVIY